MSGEKKYLATPVRKDKAKLTFFLSVGKSSGWSEGCIAMSISHGRSFSGSVPENVGGSLRRGLVECVVGGRLSKVLMPPDAVAFMHKLWTTVQRAFALILDSKISSTWQNHGRATAQYGKHGSN